MKSPLAVRSEVRAGPPPVGSGPQDGNPKSGLGQRSRLNQGMLSTATGARRRQAFHPDRLERFSKNLTNQLIVCPKFFCVLQSCYTRGYETHQMCLVWFLANSQIAERTSSDLS
jgi:hypothetical protein